MFYVDFVEFGKGANLGCSVILQSLLQHAQLRGYLPRRLRVQCDNTSADYKNSTTLRCLGYFVSRGVFDEVNLIISGYKLLDQSLIPRWASYVAHLKVETLVRSHRSYRDFSLFCLWLFFVALDINIWPFIRLVSFVAWLSNKRVCLLGDAVLPTRRAHAQWGGCCVRRY